jgi:hypothetical protein
MYHQTKLLAEVIAMTLIISAMLVLAVLIVVNEVG